MATNRLTVVNYLMAGVFTLSAALQCNDPDPVPWVGFYSAAALVSVASARRRAVVLHAGTLAAIGVVWAVAIGLSMEATVTAADVFASLSMRTKEVEEAREIGGITIVVSWMLTIAADRLRSRSR